MFWLLFDKILFGLSQSKPGFISTAAPFQLLLVPLFILMEDPLCYCNTLTQNWLSNQKANKNQTNMKTNKLNTNKQKKKQNHHNGK